MWVHSEHAQQMERQHEAHISDSQAGLCKEAHTDYTCKQLFLKYEECSVLYNFINIKEGTSLQARL